MGQSICVGILAFHGGTNCPWKIFWLLKNKEKKTNNQRYDRFLWIHGFCQHRTCVLYSSTFVLRICVFIGYMKKTSRNFFSCQKNQSQFLTRTRTEQNWNQFEILPIWFLSTADISVEHNMNISLAFKYSLQFLGLVWYWVFNFHSNRTFVRIYPALSCSVQFTQFQCHLKMFCRCGDV